MYTRSFEGKRAGADGRMREEQGLSKTPVSCWRRELCCVGGSICVRSGCCDERLEEGESCWDEGLDLEVGDGGWTKP